MALYNSLSSMRGIGVAAITGGIWCGPIPWLKLVRQNVGEKSIEAQVVPVGGGQNAAGDGRQRLARI